MGKQGKGHYPKMTRARRRILRKMLEAKRIKRLKLANGEETDPLGGGDQSEGKTEEMEGSSSVQEGEAEQVSLPPPKKIRLAIGTSKRGRGAKLKVGERPPLHPRPPCPSILYCFVCVKSTPSSKRARLTGEDFSALLEMLEMEEKEVDRLLVRLGVKPEMWIGLCSGCLRAVREGVKIRREMEEEVRKRQRLIVERMKGTELNSSEGGGGDSTESGSGEIRLALESILQFVHMRDYDLAPSSSVKFKVPRKFAKRKGDLISRMPPPPPPISVSAHAEDHYEEMDDELISSDPLSTDLDPDPLQVSPPKTKAPTPRPQQPQAKLKTVKFIPLRLLLPTKPLPAKKLLYCGLCGDNKAYLNQVLLQLHTNQAHRSRSRKMIMDGEEEKEDDNSDSHQIKTEVDLTKDPPEDKINATSTSANVTEGRKEPVMDSPVSYDCPNCPKVTGYTLAQFAQHLAIHQRRPLKCSICSEFFPADDDLLEQHWREKHPDQSSTEKFLKVTPDTGLIWRCGGAGCITLLPTEDARDLHEVSCSLFHKSIRLQKILPKKLSCSVCKKLFRTRDEWRLHRLLLHPEVDSKSFLYCDVSFSETTLEGWEARNDLEMIFHVKRQHMEALTTSNNSHCRHPVLFQECKECALVFEFERNYFDHLKDKHNILDKIYSCPLCEKEYTARSSLHGHLDKDHFGESLVCEVCGQRFKGEEPLVEHRFQKHDLPPEDITVYPMLTCPKEGCQFKTVLKRKFSIHTKNTHGEPGKFKCKYCGKGFKTSTHRREHQRIHENKESKPYQCEICGNSFALRNYLYIHKRLSHEGRTFPSTNKQKQRKRVPKGDKGMMTEEGEKGTK